MIECGIDDAQLDGLLDRCAAEDARDLGFALLSSRRGRPLTERALRFLAPLADDEWAWVRFEVRALIAGSR